MTDDAVVEMILQSRADAEAICAFTERRCKQDPTRMAGALVATIILNLSDKDTTEDVARARLRQFVRSAEMYLPTVGLPK